jgi:hypothetical protein
MERVRREREREIATFPFPASNDTHSDDDPTAPKVNQGMASLVAILDLKGKVSLFCTTCHVFSSATTDRRCVSSYRSRASFNAISVTMCLRRLWRSFCPCCSIWRRRASS